MVAMRVDVLNLGLDELGRVCLSDDLLDMVDSCEDFASAGANECPGSTNSSCSNSNCGYSLNSLCSNTSCTLSTNRVCFDGLIE